MVWAYKTYALSDIETKRITRLEIPRKKIKSFTSEKFNLEYINVNKLLASICFGFTITPIKGMTDAIPTASSNDVISIKKTKNAPFFLSGKGSKLNILFNRSVILNSQSTIMAFVILEYEG